MKNLFKRFFGLVLSSDEQIIINHLNMSGVDSKRVVGRGGLTVRVSDITSSDKFKSYSQKASVIVSARNK